MQKVLRFIAYLYLKVILLIGYDLIFDREAIFGQQSNLLTDRTQSMIYGLATLIVIPVLDTIIMALPIYISLKRRRSQRWIMLSMTFVLEFVVYYYAVSHKAIEPKFILKSIFSILLFLLLYRKVLFVKANRTASIS